MDYDDGFVAYLNGVEIARSHMDNQFDFPRFDVMASSQHEAWMYLGLSPEVFSVNSPYNLLKAGENVLAVQVHNIDTGSSDLSAIPYFSVGTIEKPEIQRTIDILNLKTNDFHTNFKLDADGESIYLTDPSGVIADSVRFGSLMPNTSYGRSQNNPEIWTVFLTSTPGNENSEEGLTEEKPGVPIFSIPAGIYSINIQVSLIAPEWNDTIYYTTDGSIPTRLSAIYSREFNLHTSKVIRARILKSGMQPGETVTNSYIIYSNKNLPLVSISMDPTDLWDYYSGIYVKGPNAQTDYPYFGANYWMDWEKACHFEMMESVGNKVIDVDAGVRIYGNWTRANEQKSMAFYCRKSYGSEYFKHKIFKERPFDEFKDLVLRNSGNDWNITMFRDGLMTGLTKDLNVDQMAFRPAIIFLNGDYWGILNIREKINEYFIAKNHDVKPEDVTLLEGNGSPIVGNADDWWKMYSFVQQNTLNIQSNYDQVIAQIDLDSFTDYFISEIFFRNHDWPGNNIKYWKTNDKNGRWRWIIFDTDFGMGIWNTLATDNTLALATATNGPDWPNPPWSTLMLRRMLENIEFRNKFVNRFADLLNSTFLAERVIKAIDVKRDLIADEIGNHFLKWNTDPQNNWLWNVQMMKNFASERPANVFEHIRLKFNYKNPQAITVRADLTQGNIQLNSLQLTKFPWRGSYFQEVPVSLTAMPKAGYRFVKWIGITAGSNTSSITVTPMLNLDLTAVFESDGNHYDDIVINEISYNNAAPEDPGDWIEFYNKGMYDIDISGWKITDADPNHQFIFAVGTLIKANEYLVVCNDLIKMKTVFGSVKNLYETFAFNFGLGNTVDAVKLYSRENQLIDEVNYSNDESWQTYTFDELWSLELINPNKDNNSGYSWTLSEKNGTPGIHNTLYIPDAISDWHVAKNTPELFQNYPNPFLEGTSIEFKMNSPGKYLLSIFDVNGRIIRNMAGDSRLSDLHSLYWDGCDAVGKQVIPGVYFYRLECDGFSEVKQMIKM